MFLLFALAEASDGEAAGSGSFPPFESEYFASQLFWLAIFFGALFWVFSSFIIPRLRETLEKRGDRIAGDLDEAERLNNKAQTAREELEELLSSARAEARKTAEAAQAEAAETIREESAKVEAEIEVRLAQAEATIAETRKAEMAKVEDLAVNAAMSIVSKFGGAIDKSEAESAVSEALRQEARS